MSLEEIPLVLAPKFTQVRQHLTDGTPQSWLNTVFSHIDMGIGVQNDASIAISNLEAGYEVQISASGKLWPDPVSCPEGFEILQHGCNPFYLPDILRDGLRPSKGKENYVGIWCTRWAHTAFGYPQEMPWEGVSLCNLGPNIKVVLEVLADTRKRTKSFRGKKNKLTDKITNQQVVYPVDAVTITKVRIIGMRAAIKAISKADDLEPRVKNPRKWRQGLRDARKHIRPHNIRDVDIVSELAFRPPPRITEQRKKGARVRRVRRRTGKVKRSVVLWYQKFKHQLTV